MKENTLRTNLEKLRSLESRIPGVFSDDIRQITQKLQHIDEDRYRGTLARARAEHWAAGETPTKRASGTEKSAREAQPNKRDKRERAPYN